MKLLKCVVRPNALEKVKEAVKNAKKKDAPTGKISVEQEGGSR